MRILNKLQLYSNEEHMENAMSEQSLRAEAQVQGSLTEERVVYW